MFELVFLFHFDENTYGVEIFISRKIPNFKLIL